MDWEAPALAGLRGSRGELDRPPDPAGTRRPEMVPKHYEFIGFGDIHGPKPYKFIGFGDAWAGRPEIVDVLEVLAAPVASKS